jgi:DNA-binding response OmpR family regulator
MVSLPDLYRSIVWYGYRMRILVIEDNIKLAQSLKRGFEQEGYAVDVLIDGEEGEHRLQVSHADYDLLVLDLTLPGKGGVDICVSLREKGIMIPIIMLTARDTTQDKVLGLDSGADDYLVKPFSFEELLSRVRALSRRPRAALTPELQVGELVLKPASQEAEIRGIPLGLTLKEFRILEYFMQHADEALSRQQIIDHLWDFSFNPLSRVMDVHINNLRNKLQEHDHAQLLETVRGIGYRLRG